VTPKEEFSAAETALIEKITYAVLERALPRVIELHQKSCPAPEEIDRMKARFRGFMCGIGAAGFVVGWIVTKVLEHVFQ
jgi:hypothetical protein